MLRINDWKTIEKALRYCLKDLERLPPDEAVAMTDLLDRMTHDRGHLFLEHLHQELHSLKDRVQALELKEQMRKRFAQRNL